MTSTLNYRWSLDDLCEIIVENQYSLISLQMPEGLKRHTADIAQAIEERTGATTVTTVEPCFGACDIPDHELKRLGADCIVQFGHSEIPSLRGGYALPTHFVELAIDLDVREVVEKAIPLLTGTAIALTTTVQHIAAIDAIEKILAEHGMATFVGAGGDRIAYPGQILGCNFSAAEVVSDNVDSILYFGSGMFHPLGMALATKKPVVIADPYTGEAQTADHERERILRQRSAAIARATDAQRFGIIVGLKMGQMRMADAVELKKRFEEHDREALIFAANRLEADQIDYLDIDAFVSTMCPRIAIDDAQRYKKPMLTPVEAEIVLGIRSWDEYAFDTFR